MCCSVSECRESPKDFDPNAPAVVEKGLLTYFKSLKERLVLFVSELMKIWTKIINHLVEIAKETLQDINNFFEKFDTTPPPYDWTPEATCVPFSACFVLFFIIRQVLVWDFLH
jgi:hypothetical protein